VGVVDAATLTKIKTGLEVASKIDWTTLTTAYKKSDWLEVGSVTVHDVAQIIKPFYPQAGVADAILQVLLTLAKSKSGKSGSGSIDTKLILQALIEAQSIDWMKLHDAMRGDDPIKAGMVFTSTLAKVATPFVPQAAFAAGIIDGLILFSENTHPVMQYHYDGYTWDPLKGWVADDEKLRAAQEEAMKDPYKHWDWDPFKGWVPKRRQ
jgi:hypothetical protein